MGTNDSFKNKDDEVIFLFEITERHTKLTLTYIDDSENLQYGILKKVEIDNDDMKIYLKLENIESSEYKVNIEQNLNSDEIILVGSGIINLCNSPTKDFTYIVKIK